VIKLRGKAVGMFVAILAVAAGLEAQEYERTGRWALSGWAGAAIPVKSDSVRSQTDVGALYGFGAAYYPTSHWGVGIDGENLEFEDDANTNGKYYMTLRPVTLSAVYCFFEDNIWTPYLTAGLGKYGERGVRTDGEDDTVWGGKVGAGIEYFPRPFFSVSPQVVYHMAAKGGDGSRAAHAAAPALKLTVYFGQKAEEPPDEPVAASAPEVDTDGDGVYDAFDKCPDTPKGATVDGDGCPADDDKDTVWNGIDQCANTPVDRIADETGCPMPEKVNIDLHIQFDNNRADIKEMYRDQIAKVAMFMRTYPAVTAEIEGHTDSVGSSKKNTALSRQRADNVKKYLVKEFGIDAARLTARGYGPSRPIADNGTEEGRAMNRRVVASLETTR
jgi:OmpA-OmpF porin, OOP family